MRVVLNTHVDDAASRACIHRLSESLRTRGVTTDVNAWDGYAHADVAVFMAYDHDMEAARAANPAIRVVLADPKQRTTEAREDAARADLLLVSSVEQRESFLRLNRNVLIHYMFVPLPPVEPRRHVDATPLVVAYHGNRVHLEAMRDSVSPALDVLARQRPVELVAIYNVAAYGKARLDMRSVEVRHVQWTDEFVAELARADIGIAPNELPLLHRLDALELTASDDGELMYEPFDHLVRFKASTNAGRLYPFAHAGLPVVSDFVPSAAQFVLDGESGFLASSPEAWYEAFVRLAESPELRARCAANLAARLAAAYEAQVDALVAACAAPLRTGPVGFTDRPSTAAAAARLERYAGPAGSSPLRRWAARLRR